VSLDEVPLAFQYNKRDLANILSVEELDEALNRDKAHESYEASAILGQGVFETLKAISRLTLRSLKKRMSGEDRPSRPTTPPALKPPPPREAAPPPEPSESAAPPVEEARPAVPTPGEVAEAERATIALSRTPVGEPIRVPRPVDHGPTEIEFEPDTVSFAESAQATPSPEEGVKHVRVGSNVDILAELERLRKNATSLSPASRPTRRASSGVSVDDLLANSLNHRKEVSRVFDVDVSRRELAAGHHVAVTLQFTDRNNGRVGNEKTFSIPLESAQDLEKLVLALKVQIFGK
jgi:hypothetical protein